MKIQESAENYLETILILNKKKGSVRSIDVATELNFSKPSVSIAMKNLREKMLINIDKDGFITLTKEGQVIADIIYERHTFLSEWFMTLCVDQKTATEDACRIEHVISEKSFDALKKFVESK